MVAINRISLTGGEDTFQQQTQVDHGNDGNGNACSMEYLGTPIYDPPQLEPARRVSHRHHRPPTRYGIDDVPMVT